MEGNKVDSQSEVDSCCFRSHFLFSRIAFTLARLSFTNPVLSTYTQHSSLRLHTILPAVKGANLIPFYFVTLLQKGMPKNLFTDLYLLLNLLNLD